MTRLLIFGLLLSVIGCDLPDRVGRLEKENKELKATESERNRVASYDLQATCAKDAREWFNANWANDRSKNTLLLDFTNHYNKRMNKCFVMVEYHYSTANPDWTNHISLW